MTILLETTRTDLLASVRTLYAAHLEASALSEKNRLHFLHTLINLEHVLVADFKNLLKYQFLLSREDRKPLVLIFERSLTDSPSSINRFSPIFDKSNNPISKLDSFMEWFTAELDRHVYSEEEKMWNTVPSEDESEEDTQEVRADDEYYFGYIPGSF